MPINSVSLISGALSFSAALAWNRAISETLSSMTQVAPSPITQAVIITLIIIIIVFIVNISIKYYIKYKKTHLKKSVTLSGGDKHSKVSLWSFNNK